MSDKNDFTVLNAIFIALPADKIWGGGRYRKAGEEKCPSGTLRLLSERGLVEVETRACSLWSYGPKPPPFYKPQTISVNDWNQMAEDYKAFDPVRRGRKFKSRSDVVAHITDKGIEYLVMLRASRI